MDNIPGYGNGSVTIERFKANKVTSLIFRNPANKIVSNTIVFKKISQSGLMKGKKDSVFAYTLKQNDETKKLERHQCKMAVRIHPLSC